MALTLLRTSSRFIFVDNLCKKCGPSALITSTQTPSYRAYYIDGTFSLFSTQDNRHVLAHPFSYASVKQFEGWIRKSVGKRVRKLDSRAGLGVGAGIPGCAAGSVTSGGSGGVVDVLMWLSYLTFNVIADLAFDEPLGMLERETDVLVGDSDHPSNGADKKDKGVAAMIDYRGP
ncbi:hypothetical protein M422DRAFT_243508 [Sphaerobolus stellatus SS14]|nr:hypothetical protein M422DRAFT_243508 [Sphaerobolus stellatus SS14]